MSPGPCFRLAKNFKMGSAEHLSQAERSSETPAPFLCDPGESDSRAFSLHICAMMAISSGPCEVGSETYAFFFNCRLIAFQCCGALCRTSRGIGQNPMYVPSVLSLPTPKLSSRKAYAVVSKWRPWGGICMRDEEPL